MNYQKIYDALIQRAEYENRKKYKRTDSRYTYYESHHIIPDCFYINRIRRGPIGWLIGNPNDKDNRVLLTPEEHLLAHLCLVKIYPDNHGLIKAAMLMSVDSNGMRINNKQFGWLRKRDSIAKTGKPSLKKGQPMSEAQKLKLSIAKKGKPAHNKGLKSTTPSPKKGKKHSRPNINKGTPTGRSPSNKGKTSPCKGIKLGPSTKFVCPHCENIIGGAGNYSRWHGDNCKNKG
jgi:hypothetical protein